MVELAAIKVIAFLGNERPAEQCRCDAALADRPLGEFGAGGDGPSASVLSLRKPQGAATRNHEHYFISAGIDNPIKHIVGRLDRDVKCRVLSEQHF